MSATSFLRVSTGKMRRIDREEEGLVLLVHDLVHGNQEGERKENRDYFVLQHVDEDEEVHVNVDGGGEVNQLADVFLLLHLLVGDDDEE